MGIGTSSRIGGAQARAPSELPTRLIVTLLSWGGLPAADLSSVRPDACHLMRDSSVIEVDAQAALERVFCRAVQAADVPGIARPGVAGAAAGCLMAHGLPGNPVAAGRMLVYLVPPAAVTSAGRLSGLARRLCGGRSSCSYGSRWSRPLERAASACCR